MPESEAPRDLIQNEPGAAPAPAVPADWEPERAMALIQKFRDQERNTKANLRGIGMSPDAIGRIVGTENNDEPTPPPAADTSEIKQLRLRASVLDAIHDAGADRALTLAVLQQNKGLDAINPDADTLPDDLADLLDETMARYPQLRTRTNLPPLSGLPFPGGSGGTAPITRDDIAKMSPDEVTAAFEKGDFSHLGVGAPRRTR